MERVRQGEPERLRHREDYEPSPLIAVLLGAIYLFVLLGRGCTAFFWG